MLNSNRRGLSRLIHLWTIELILFLAILLPSVPSQAVSKLDKDRGRSMLNVIKNDLKKNYYDQEFHGMDVEARFKVAEEKLEQAQSLGQIFGIIAQVMLELDDSHAFFVPPPRSSRTEYGIKMQIYGDKGYVVAVKPGCDAEAKGIKVGDMVHSISGYQPSRELMWKLKYLFYTLRPQPGLRLVVQSPNGQPREVEMLAKITQGQRILDLTGDGLWQYLRDAEAEDRLNRHRYYEAGEEAFIWKMPQFDLTDSDIDMMLEKVKKRKALILDLRGNSGGAVVTLQRLVANVLDKDIKIADLQGRKEMKPMLAKTRGADRVFKGKIVVLIDHESGSAAEIFARIMQLEKRGTVIGDRSAGAVMQSKFYQHEVGADTVVPYGASITDANLIMADGKSLEKIGVSPDEIVLPTGADLAAKRDPVLSRAAALLGLALDPEKAGMMFPTEWRK